MAIKLLVIAKCPFCHDYVEEVPDGVLKREPHHHNAEFVVTHSGHKQYIHTSCWNEMIKKQKGEI